MTVFERSPEGIMNRALFLGADFIAYHEGNASDPACIDTMFWQNIFSLFAPGTSITFLPSGAKTDILEMVRQLPENSRSTFFLLDRDYDDLLGCQLSRRDVMYTHGYSCENDIFSPGGIDIFLYRQFPVPALRARWLAAIQGFFEASHDHLRTVAVLDQKFKRAGIKGVATDGFQRVYLDPKIGKEPLLNPQAIEAERERLSAETQAGSDIPSDDDWGRRINGHFLMDLSFRLTVHLSRAIDRRFSIEKRFFVRALLGIAFEGFGTDGSKSTYFAQRVANLMSTGADQEPVTA